MSEVRPVVRIGKTQWRKWNEAQKFLFNALCTQGRPVSAAIKAVNEGETTLCVAEEPAPGDDAVAVTEEGVVIEPKKPARVAKPKKQAS